MISDMDCGVKVISAVLKKNNPHHSGNNRFFPGSFAIIHDFLESICNAFDVVFMVDYYQKCVVS